MQAGLKKQGVSVRGLLACLMRTAATRSDGLHRVAALYGAVTYFPETAGGKYYLPQAPTSALCLAEPRLAGNLRGTRNETRAKEERRSYKTPGGRISVSDESRCLAAEHDPFLATLCSLGRYLLSLRFIQTSWKLGNLSSQTCRF